MQTRIAILLVALAAVLTACSSGSSSGAKATATPGSKTTVNTPFSATIVRTPTSTLPAATLASNSTTTLSSAAGVHCGTERWPVKTLSDSNAGLVNFTPVHTTVSQLRSFPKPSSLPEASRIGPDELTVYTVTAQLVE